MRIFEIKLDNTWHDITGLYVPRSYVLQQVAVNGEHKSSVSSCSFSIYFDQQLYDAVMACTGPVPVRVSDGLDVEFFGQMDPVFSASWQGGLEPRTVDVECVDFSVALDGNVAQSASYPASVGGTPFKIYDRDDKEGSILYRVLETAGLADKIDRGAPSIQQEVRHIAWSAGDRTYRDIIDSLLADYGWVLVVRGDRLTWVRTAYAEMGRVDDIGPGDITGTVSKDRDYIVEDSVSVKWPKTKVMEDALLWRGDLPIGDTSNPRPGEPIASGDYWPEDSDIIETWQDFGVDYLDTEWLEGTSRLRNEELTLVSSSDWALKDSRDEGVVVDPVEDGRGIVYEALRARFRYRNTSESTKRLYYSEVHGRALVKTHMITSSLPEGGSKPATYEASSIYDKDAAERLARIRWMWMTDGACTFTFSSQRKLVPGDVYMLHQGGLYEGFIQVLSARIQDGSQVISYTATSTAPFRELPVHSQGSQGSGSSSPGQDGSEYVNAYKRSYEKPARPTGSTPIGWTLDAWPEGDEPLWQSSAKFDSTGKMLVEWSDPMRVSGVPAPTVRYIYKRDYNQPPTPAGDAPAGWTFDVVPDGYEPVWQSIGQFGETGNLVGTWTTPVRVSGQDRGGYRGAVDSLPTDPQDGDFILYTGPTSGNLQQYHAYKYVAIDDQWVETTESDKIMALQKDALQIAKDTGELIYAALIYVELLVARKLMIGGGTEYEGLLIRFLDDDGTGKPLIEIRYGGARLFYLDVDTGKLYGNFARVVQYLPFPFNDSLDSTHPAIFDFYIPEGEIVWIRIRVKAQKFRTYSASTTMDGEASTYTSFFGGIDKEIWLERDIMPSQTSAEGGHNHTYTQVTGVQNGRTGISAGTSGDMLDGVHSHDGSFYDGGHSHSVKVSDSGHGHGLTTTTRNTGSVPDHYHDYYTFELKQSGSYEHEHIVDITHTHGMALGIIEGATASGMTLAFDNTGEGSFSSPVPITSGTEITKEDCPALGSATPGGWKSLRITSTSLGRVQVHMTIKMRIDTDDDL